MGKKTMVEDCMEASDKAVALVDASGNPIEASFQALMPFSVMEGAAARSRRSFWKI